MNDRTAVIIAAAGGGSRMRSATAKQFLDLGGMPMLSRCVRAFTAAPCIDAVVVVVPAGTVETSSQMVRDLVRDDLPIDVIAGGARRQDSVRQGLAALADDIGIVLVHDGARPLVSTALIERCHVAITRYGAAVAAVPVTDTLKREDGRCRVVETVDRTALWQAQTPQGARRDLLERAFAGAAAAEATDEASLLERAGIDVRIVRGEEANFKITEPEDLILAEAVLASRAPAVRIGHGFDAHRFDEGGRLVLGGVAIDHHRGLAGHSDADVVCHALCDAILGAAGAGDIGRHFPDSDERFKDISSLTLLDRVVELAAVRHLEIANADLTIICQEPRLARFLRAMERAMAARCRVDADRFNVKATTTERMGPFGRAEGIGCHAVVIMQRTLQYTNNDRDDKTYENRS